MAEHPFLRACRREPVERTSAWLIRQADRYIHEYRAIRKEVSFLEPCKNPELACEVTMPPINEFGSDAAILPSTDRERVRFLVKTVKELSAR